MPGSHPARRDRLRAVLAAADADAALITTLVNVRYLTGLASSNAALLVAADADLDAAADAAAWGAVSNAGQTCIGVERVFVEAEVYHTFLEKLTERMSRARPGDDRESAYGPMTCPAQADIVEDHVADALARGGRAVLGGMQSIRRPYVEPVILADVPETSLAVQEETFGPTVTVTKISGLDEGVALANASRYALGATVFARNKKRAMAAARRVAGTPESAA